MVLDRREGVSVYYRMVVPFGDAALDALWTVLRGSRLDPLVQQDLARIPQVLRKRSGGDTWADSVAGDMERHYSPGRTWEVTARALVHLIQPGDVLDVASGDGVLAELLAPAARSVVCVDVSEKVVAAGRRRLEARDNVRFEIGDMHDLPVAASSFDTVLLMHALTYTTRAGQVLAEAVKALRPDGRLLAVTLAEHSHRNAVQPYNHANLGFSPRRLTRLAEQAGLEVAFCDVSAIEKRAPYFAVLTLFGRRPPA
jgi:ArsR family transcriptional regulator